MQISKSPNLSAPRPTVPTMTSASVIPPMPEPPKLNGLYPLELDETITAMPLTSPSFTDLPLKNPTRVGRWIFTAQRRYSEALAQGWVVTKLMDVKPDHNSPYSVENGTKFINGDLIHMHIDRQRYLGALKYKHQVAAALADSNVQKRINQQRAQSEMGTSVAAANAKMAAMGKRPAMEAFVPGAEDFPEGRMPGVLGDDAVAGKELGRLGHEGGPDIMRAADIKPL